MYFSFHRILEEMKLNTTRLKKQKNKNIGSHLYTTKSIPTESRFNDETKGIKSDSRFVV